MIFSFLEAVSKVFTTFLCWTFSIASAKLLFPVAFLYNKNYNIVYNRKSVIAIIKKYYLFTKNINYEQSEAP
jgi:hypothetical protein